MGRAIAAVVASVLLLAGCAQTPVAPAGLTADEVTAILAEQNAVWWTSVYPEEPPPNVEVVEYVNPYESTEIIDCILAAHVPGVVADGGGFTFQPTDPVVERLYALAQYTCSMKYPYDPAFAEQMGLYSDEQLEYLYAYFTERLEPCLTANGERVYVHPTREEFLANAPYLSWSPYDAIEQRETPEEWAQLDFRCPPPSVAYLWRSGVNY